MPRFLNKQNVKSTFHKVKDHEIQLDDSDESSDYSSNEQEKLE